MTYTIKKIPYEIEHDPTNGRYTYFASNDAYCSYGAGNTAAEAIADAEMTLEDAIDIFMSSEPDQFTDGLLKARAKLLTLVVPL